MKDLLEMFAKAKRVFVAEMVLNRFNRKAGILTPEEADIEDEEALKTLQKAVIDGYNEIMYESKELFEEEKWVRWLEHLGQWREKELPALEGPADTAEAEEERKRTEEIRKEEERETKKRYKAKKKKKKRARLRKEIEDEVAVLIHQAKESGVKLRKKDISDYRRDLREEYREKYVDYSI